MTKRFKLHIDWFNYDKTDGEATLSDNGQPLLESDCVEDMRRLKDLLNELNDKNEQLKFVLGKLNILYKAKCKTEEQLLEMGKEVEKENEQLKQSIQEYKAILQDMGILMSDEDVINIRNDITDKLLKPLFKSNGFDVDIDTTDGFTIIPKGDVE